MLRVVQRFGSNPVSVPVNKVDLFEPGMFAQIKNDGLAGTSDGTSVIGIIDDVRKLSKDSTMASGRVCVWMTDGIFSTDQFEINEYIVNDNLYVNSSGELSRYRMFKGQPSIGMLLAPPKDGSLEFRFKGGYGKDATDFTGEDWKKEVDLKLSRHNDEIISLRKELEYLKKQFDKAQNVDEEISIAAPNTAVKQDPSWGAAFAAVAASAAISVISDKVAKNTYFRKDFLPVEAVESVK